MNIRALLKELRISLVATLCLGVILCGFYPIGIWGLGQGLFPREANGSLIVKGGKTAGSSLLAQGFAGAKYFHPRPSAAGSGYDAAGSGGSNLGPLSKKLTDDMAQRVRDYRAENNLAPGVPIPADAASIPAPNTASDGLGDGKLPFPVIPILMLVARLTISLGPILPKPSFALAIRFLSSPKFQTRTRNNANLSRTIAACQ